MTRTATSDVDTRRDPIRSRANGVFVATVVAPCSASKCVQISPLARAVSLVQAPQVEVETAWRRRVIDLPASIAAGDLYCGRGFATARQAATRIGADFVVASAGLGLVRSSRIVPAYGLTVVGRTGPDALRGRVLGQFDPTSWWRGLQGGPYATAFRDVFEGVGLVIMALSHAYAQLLTDDLAALDEAHLGRVRIVGAGLAPHLPQRVRNATLLPYDDRLDAYRPGVRGDFCQRALAHFVDLLASADARTRAANDIAAHRTLVEAALGRPHVGTPPRTRVSDEVIAQRISARLRADARRPGVALLLRTIRDEDGIACEAARFSRLYRLVAADAPARANR